MLGSRGVPPQDNDQEIVVSPTQGHLASSTGSSSNEGSISYDLQTAMMLHLLSLWRPDNS